MGEPATALLDAIASLPYDASDMAVTVRDKKGNGCFWVFVHRDSDRASVSVGSKAAAEAVKVDVERKLALASLVDRKVRLKSLLREALATATPEPTVREYAAEWIQQGTRVYGWKLRTASEYQGALDRQVLPSLGDEPLSAITRQRVKAWCGELSTEMAQSTVRWYFRILSSMLTSAVEDGLLPANPCAGRKRWFRADKKRPPTWADGELKTILDAARFEPDPIRTLAPLLDQTGMRISEARGLRWCDVDFGAGHLTVAHQLTKAGELDSTKGRRCRTLPLPEIIRPPAGEGWVVDTVNSHGIYYLWRKFLEKIDVEHRGFHTFRHTWASRELLAGTPPLVVSRRLGHASSAFTMDKYGHLPAPMKTEDDQEAAG